MPLWKAPILPLVGFVLQGQVILAVVFLLGPITCGNVQSNPCIPQPRLARGYFNCTMHCAADELAVSSAAQQPISESGSFWNPTMSLSNTAM